MLLGYKSRMNEVTLPPSPNWYMSNILACSKRGTIAWGAKNFIVIARQEKDNDAFQFSVITDFHKVKITAVAFCHKLDNPDSPELLVSGGDDDKVKLWNVNTLKLITKFSFNDEGKTITGVVGVDWSIKDNNLVYAVNINGFLMCCNVQYETAKIVPLGKLIATCLACCPHESSLIAIGTKSGLIYIVEKETILYTMRGHNEEIVSLSWCPSDMNVLNGNKRDLLLASGAKDRSVFIWRAGRDGRYETEIKLPNAPLTSSYQHKSKLSTVTGTWIPVCWAEPKVLLTSSVWGELLSWDLSTSNKSKYKLFHSHHSRGLFCIATVPKDNEISDNWRADSDLTVWTLALDRWVVCSRKRNSDPANSAIVEYKIPTQGGFVYCMAPCSIDTSRIVFGVGDAMLRLWNLSEPHATTFDITMYWQKIKGKIRAVSWFPDDESTVAFATGEGRIGVFEAIGTLSKPPILYRQYHRKTVYKIEWARLGQDYFLFSCSEGELVAYKKSAPNDEPMSIVKKECTEFSWKSNLCLAVAQENGSIMFYDQKLKKCGSTIHILRNIINCLAWHPESTATDAWTSQTANYLAVASNSNSITVFDMSELINKLKATDTEDYFKNEEVNQECEMYKIVATLNGHSEKVVCLAWSPHVSGFLVSGSYDNVAQVWNVEKQELIGTYLGHSGPVLCCMWSPLKSQLIMTGSSDFMLRIWDYTLPAQSPKQPSDIKAAKKMQKQQKVQKKSLASKTNDSEYQNLAALKSPVNQSAEVNDLNKLQILPKKKERKSYFDKYNKTVNASKLMEFIKDDIRKNQGKIEEDDTIVNLSLFCEKRENFVTLLAMEKAAQDNSNAMTEMDMWLNRTEFGYTMSLEDRLIHAAKNQQLNDFLVSLAPSISMKMWKEMCQAYAHQLISQRNVEKAVSYLLCIHKIYEAIEAFLKAGMYKEAYVLAKCRLDSDDPFLTKILISWAEKAYYNGQLEQAVHCYVKLGQFDKAAKILARRKDVHCIEVASELAFLSGDERYGISLVIDAMTCALMKSDWSKARSLIADIRQLQYLNVHIDVHEAIISIFEKQTELDSMRMWLKGNESHGMLQALEKEYCASYYDALCKNANTNVTLKNKTNNATMQLRISYEIATAVTCKTRETRLKHIVKALGDIFDYEETIVKHGIVNKGLFTHILTKLDTKKPTDEDSIYAKSSYLVSESIRAYLCIGLLNWLLIHSEQLSIEEETEFTQLILDLLNNALNETTISYQENIKTLNQLSDQILMLEPEEAKFQEISLEIEKLRSVEDRFKKERVCMPNPSIVFQKACLVADILRHASNKFQLLFFLNMLVELKQVTPSKVEENLLKNIDSVQQ